MAPESSKGNNAKPESGGPIRVLLCDADPDSAARLRTVLESQAGVVVGELVEGADALAPAIKKQTPDMVLANLDPDPGVVLAAVAKLAREHPDLHFYAASAHNDAELILKAMRSGFSDVIRLPDESDRLGQVIRSVRDL